MFQSAPRIVIPGDAPPVMAPSEAYRKLLERVQVDYHDTLPGTEERLIERIAGAEIVINIRSSSRFSANVFRQSPNIQLLSLWGTGTDNVDLEAAARHSVAVTNTPGVSAASVAEHALTLLLATARRISHLDSDVRQGRWPRGQVSQNAWKDARHRGPGSGRPSVRAVGNGRWDACDRVDDAPGPGASGSTFDPMFAPGAQRSGRR